MGRWWPFEVMQIICRKGADEGHALYVIELKKVLELIAAAGDAG